ncbi:hypothetical protein AAC387_Pa01g1668 [Persea americana]
MDIETSPSIPQRNTYSLPCLLGIPLLILFSGLILFGSGGRSLFNESDLLSSLKNFGFTDNGSSLSRYQPKNSPEASVLDEFEKCNPEKAILKVFMYDLPSDFHFGLFNWKAKKNGSWPDLHSVVPRYPGGLYQQHSIEYWLTLDLLSSTFPDRPGPCSAIRVENSEEADVVFVPFFSSLSYDRHSDVKPPDKRSKNQLLQEQLVEFLTAQEEWKRSGGRDHVILAHHPASMLNARMKLSPGVLILSDFARYPPNIANVEKDVIAPYKHVVGAVVNDSSGFDSRPTLMYFRGGIKRKDGGYIRKELFELLKDEEDVHFASGSPSKDGIRNATRGMHMSKFCLNIAGDTPSSNRIFDAIASQCIPVIISNDIDLPYEDVLDYSEFCIFVRSVDARKKGFLVNLIRSIGRDEWTRMWRRLKQIAHHFEFQYPSQKNDAVQMTWQAVARKVPALRLKVHKSRRFSWSDMWKGSE